MHDSDEAQAYEVRINQARECVLEVARGRQSVAYVKIDSGAVRLLKKPVDEFDEEYCYANEESSPRKFARHYLGAAKYWTLEHSVYNIFVDIITLEVEERGDNVIILVDPATLHIVGHLANLEDANLVAASLPFRSIKLRGPESLEIWLPEEVVRFRNIIRPGLPAPKPAELRGNKFKQFCEGVFQMAKEAAKKPAVTAPKAAKVTNERAPKGEGPVAQIHAYLTKNQTSITNGKLSRKDATKALVEMGINKGTIGVQVGKWCTESKVSFQKAEPAEKPAKAPKTDKTAVAKAPAKAATPAPKNGAGVTKAPPKAAAKKGDKPAQSPA